jgi:hypothetical protein
MIVVLAASVQDTNVTRTKDLDQKHDVDDESSLMFYY